MTPTRTLGLSISLVLCTACASTAPLTPESSQALSGSTIVGSAGETPDFTAFTPGKAGFGLIGASLMKSTGNEVVARNGIRDPAAGIADALLEDLAARHGARPVSSSDGAAYALEVKTTDWRYAYLLSTTSPQPYRVLYAATATLKDARSGAVIAQGKCNGDPGRKETAPSLDEMLADNAARLKSELAAAADLCLAELRDTVFAPTGASAG